MKELTIPLKHLRQGEPSTAFYLPHEERAVLAHIRKAEEAGTPRAVVERELEFLHLLKAELEAVLLP